MHSKKTKYIVLLVLLISMGFGYLARGFLDESATHQPLENMISTQINAKASENAHNRITQENSVKEVSARSISGLFGKQTPLSAKH